eukprot:gene16194-22356_t
MCFAPLRVFVLAVLWSINTEVARESPVVTDIGLAIGTELLDDHPCCHVLMGSRDLPGGQQAVKL